MTHVLSHSSVDDPKTHLTVVDATDAQLRSILDFRSARCGGLAEAVVFLASDKAGFITGATLAADGGAIAV